MSAVEVDAMARLLILTGAQREAAEALAASGQAELNAEIDRSKPVYQQWNGLPRDRRTAEARKKLIADLRAVEPDREALRTRVLRDIKQTLTDEQAALWPAFERFVRRERWLRHGEGGGNRTNILAILHRVQVDPRTIEGLPVLLDRYERALDILLLRLGAAENTAQHECAALSPEAAPAQSLVIQGQKNQIMQRTDREIAQLNDSTAPRVLELIPDSRRPAFQQWYQDETLPDTFGFHRVNHLAMRSAATLPDLAPEVRDAVKRVLDPYCTQYAGLTAQLAAMEQRVRLEDADHRQPMDAWQEIRVRRNELERTTNQQLEALLTKPQWESVQRVWRAWDVENEEGGSR